MPVNVSVNVSPKLEEFDLARKQKLAQMREELKHESKPAKWYAGMAVKAGTKLEYISMRYGIPVETLQRWKDEWERREVSREAKP